MSSVEPRELVYIEYIINFILKRYYILFDVINGINDTYITFMSFIFFPKNIVKEEIERKINSGESQLFSLRLGQWGQCIGQWSQIRNFKGLKLKKYRC